MANAAPGVASPSLPLAPVAHAVGLGGACVFAWIAAAELIGVPPPYHGPQDYIGPLRWTVTWLWLAPLPYAFAWFVLFSRHPRRALPALAVLGVLTGVMVPVAGLALFALGPLVIMGSVPVAMLFGLAMAALQDNATPGLESEWRSAHVQGCVLALGPYSLAMATFYAMTLSPGGAPGRAAQLVVPLAMLAGGWCFHAAWCWRLLPAEQRATAPWGRVALLLLGLGGVAAGTLAWM